VQTFLVEDDPDHAAHVITSLRASSLRVRHFSRAAPFFESLAAAPPRLVVLDWMLPDVSGIDVLRRVRERCGRGLPVIMMTCVDDARMVVRALDAGADDFLVKPLPREVLRARLEAFARRIEPPQAQVVQVVDCGPYRLDFKAQTATLAGRAVALTPREFDLAWVLMNDPGRFISKTELAASVWGGPGEVASHTIAQHVHALRKKLDLTAHGMRLATVYGSGYRLDLAVPAGAVTRDDA
jgi:DNA-binding response OmpR family regulator